MADLRNFTATGSICFDLDLKRSNEGNAWLVLRVACNGFKKDDTTFIDVKFFGKTAEAAAENLRKGSKIGFSGELKQESWKDKETGKDRSKLVVCAQSLIFLDKKSENLFIFFPKRETKKAAPNGIATNRGMMLILLIS